MIDTEVQWTAPAPFWNAIINRNGTTQQLFRRPAILRFATDNFMNDFIAVLQSNPAQLKDLQAQPETWRGPGAIPVIESMERMPKIVQRLHRSKLLAQKSAVTTGLSAIKPSRVTRLLKLYQPAHQRYYLISAGLVCRIVGQPDRRIETGNQERATFVLRKVVPPKNVPISDSDEKTWKEYAFVGNGWLELDPGKLYSLAPGEEQNPLFGMNYADEDGHRRRVLAGLIPVGKRDTYVGAPERSSDQSIIFDPDVPRPPDARTLLFMAQVTEPWKRLIEQAIAWRKTIQKPLGPPITNDGPLSGEAQTRSIKDNREKMQVTSWYALLDFANLLRQHIPLVWSAIMNQGQSLPSGSAEAKLVDALIHTSMDNVFINDLRGPLYPDKNNVIRSVRPTTIVGNLRDALQQIEGGLPFDQNKAANIENKLETNTQPYDRNPSTVTQDWPNFLFPLADPVQQGPLPPAKTGVQESIDELTRAFDRIDNLVSLITAALPEQALVKTPPPLLAAQPVMGIDKEAYFVIRCVFERPNCGPLQPTVVSDATEPFLLAGFFDPDAPARPIRIGLPIDTTPAGLRRFDKNTAFMISDVLCGQIDRAKQLGLGDLIRSVLPWPLHKDLEIPDGGPCPDKVGMICSLSIPIITICALILLMIIVNLLDIIFHWIPYFILCLPFPKFDGKQAAG